MKRYKFIRYKNLVDFRKKQWENQGRTCPILKQEIPFENSVVDHKHKRKDEPYGGPEKKGLIRGVLHFQANVMEGKIARLYKRYGLDKFIDLPTLLRNLADYLENPPVQSLYVHPSEIPKENRPNLKKVDANRVYKYWHKMYPKRKRPELPKSGKMTKEWIEYVQKAKEIHEQETGVKLK